MVERRYLPQPASATVARGILAQTTRVEDARIHGVTTMHQRPADSR